ncbi:hypothetical protein, conserved [Eimeria maxima]|uniref:Uncharacterized protein n=1 Tax=Eimeria maxima TaxID=5804 RepID=U6LXU3_EIMMA|nr:hypothetical protein, conserved [Eimeria maxima]CDJ56541.1 hypothetical protein, conserved [Eimeria maxima]
MALNEGLAFSSGSVTTDATSAPGDCLRGLSDSSVGHLIEPLNFQGVRTSLGSGGPSNGADGGNEAPFLYRLSEQVAALAALLRPTRTNSERVPQQLPSGGNTLLPIQQAGHPLKYLTLASGLLTCIWGWRAGRSIERVVARRYADIAYQIRRPDALSARISAFKFLVLGGLVLPGSAVAFASLQMEATHPAGKAGDSQATQEEPDTQSNASIRRRAVLAEIVPVSLQVDMRRLVSSADDIGLTVSPA